MKKNAYANAVLLFPTTLLAWNQIENAKVHYVFCSFSSTHNDNFIIDCYITQRNHKRFVFLTER